MVRSWLDHVKLPILDGFIMFHPPFFSLYDTEKNLNWSPGEVPAFLPLNLGRGSAVQCEAPVR